MDVRYIGLVLRTFVVVNDYLRNLCYVVLFPFIQINVCNQGGGIVGIPL